MTKDVWTLFCLLIKTFYEMYACAKIMYVCFNEPVQSIPSLQAKTGGNVKIDFAIHSMGVSYEGWLSLQGPIVEGSCTLFQRSSVESWSCLPSTSAM